MKTNLKTPVSYYGGKQMMLKEILPLIPEHKIYVEPFFGGGVLIAQGSDATIIGNTSNALCFQRLGDKVQDVMMFESAIYDPTGKAIGDKVFEPMRRGSLDDTIIQY